MDEGVSIAGIENIVKDMKGRNEQLKTPQVKSGLIEVCFSCW